MQGIAKVAISGIRCEVRKTAKVEPTFHKDLAFDELANDTLDYMETKDAQDVGRTRYVVHEKRIVQKMELPKVSTDKEEVSTDRPDEGTADQTEGRSATQTAPTTTTPTIFGDDETITQPLPKIDPQDKGKKKIEEEDESNTELEGITEAEKKFKKLAMDEEVTRKIPRRDTKGFNKILWEIANHVHTIMTDEGIVIHMLVENKYPLKKEVLSQLLKLKLETEEDSTMALELIRFVKK
ncbi:hypothetical protein Tco_0222523 [Tanacetum coccineum]